ncbi:hypothetical protein HDE_13300 [Halotydeus destructor]|nr:hypothetical protein HDE_13300 [Halotydeus destructor]
MNSVMKGLLFASLLIALANCHVTLNGLIDAKLKQFEHDSKMNTGEISGQAGLRYGMLGYHYHFNLYGVSKNVKRINEAELTTVDGGPVVKWKQQEPTVSPWSPLACSGAEMAACRSSLTSL